MAEEACELVSLEEARLSLAHLVGNKAAALGELKRNGVHVPPGWCVTTNAYREALEKCESDAHLSPCSQDRVSFAALRKALASGVALEMLTHSMKRCVQHILDGLDQPKLLCVRSSSSVEDRPDHSFAGLFRSFIGLRESSDVLSAIKDCWASVFADIVLDYLQDKDIDPLGILMAALLQPLVASEKSGVLFTCHPVTGEKVLAVEATWGLGVPLVEGRITPDSFLVERSGLLRSVTVGSKSMGMFTRGNSVVSRPLNDALASRVCLDKEDIGRLAVAAERIEDVLGPRQDVEFAFVGPELWILQARPITGITRRRPDCPSLGLEAGM